MPAPRFFRFAERLIFYDGVLRARMRAELDEDEPEQATHRYEPGTQVIGSSAAEIAASPLSEFISITQV